MKSTFYFVADNAPCRQYIVRESENDARMSKFKTSNATIFLDSYLSASRQENIFSITIKYEPIVRDLNSTDLAQ